MRNVPEAIRRSEEAKTENDMFRLCWGFGLRDAGMDLDGASRSQGSGCRYFSWKNLKD